MARAKKETFKYVARDERPEFIAAVAALPDDPAKLEALAEQYQRTFNAAVLAGHVDVVRAQGDALAALAVKLNDVVSRGCLGDESPLKAIIHRKAPPLGQVPLWGQDGEFLLEVDGIRIRVRARSSGLDVVLSVDLNVVDLDQIFISETGYRSTYIWADRSLGLTVDQAVRRDVEQMLVAKGGKPRMVEPDAYVRQHWQGVPAWLADLLAGVKADGQLLMGFGGESPAPADKTPLSNADRQRLFRQRQREQKAAQAAEGVQSIRLTSTERCVLSLGLLAHEDLFHRPKDWAATKKPGFDALLIKLWPEGDNGRYLAEPKRSTYRPTAFLRDQLEQSQVETRRLKEVLHQIAAEVNVSAAAPANAVQGEDFATLEVTDAPLLTVWKKLPTDFARCATALGLLRLRNNQHAELARAVEVLQTRLSAAGLSDRVTSDKKPWYWNEFPLADYRATSAPEYMERLPRKLSPADERAELARRVDYLEKEQALLEAERNKAFAANRTLTERLRRAGLATDYRPQPGE